LNPATNQCEAQTNCTAPAVLDPATN